ncbi:MAG: WYL domain-containing protein [Lachnospiraceae bacterium]|nr:WYL domain-containing protein [Lachnospiraceae bacterium]
MEGYEPKKMALLRILQILKENTNAKHPITQEKIQRILDRDYGIVLERKAISRNLSLLKESGFEIVSGRDGSYLVGTNFEDSELHLLIDGVLSSRYITARQSKDLIDRICRLTSKHFRTNAKYIHSVNDWGKTDNQALFYNIELADQAIAAGKRLEYDYNKYSTDLKLHKSSHQIVSPYRMILHNQRYYLMAYSEYWGNMVFHRLERITNMTVTEEKATPITKVSGYEHGISIKELAETKPYMYSDKPETIDMLVDASVIDQVIDWFGTGIRVRATDDPARVKVTFKASPNAMEHWAMQYIDYVEVTAPEKLREKIRESIQKGMEKYGKGEESN